MRVEHRRPVIPMYWTGATRTIGSMRYRATPMTILTKRFLRSSQPAEVESGERSHGGTGPKWRSRACSTTRSRESCTRLAG